MNDNKQCSYCHDIYCDINKYDSLQLFINNHYVGNHNENNNNKYSQNNNINNNNIIIIKKKKMVNEKYLIRNKQYNQKRKDQQKEIFLNSLQNFLFETVYQ